MTEKIRLCDVDEIEIGSKNIYSLNGGIEIGIFNIGGEYYAIENRCPHRGGPICKGQIQNEIKAIWNGPGMRIKESISSVPTIACPWHGWEFKLETGEHIGDNKISVNTYKVIIENENLYVMV
tara:strand:+ start:186 stop:554 length:369 start_codon:yes stop_codon:yes gene_type:complete